MKICVYGAASSLIDESFIKAGEELGVEVKFKTNDKEKRSLK